MDSEDTGAAPFGRFEAAVSRLFTRTAVVSEVLAVAEGYRLLTLGGPALRGVAWSPGQKLQVMLGGWVQRTFTPMSWDAEAGVTRLLVFAHGTGPGAEWAKRLRGGESCVVFGPRRSLELSVLTERGVLFGDETSIGLARALREAGGAARVLLEVTAVAAAESALAAAGVSDAKLVPRRADDAHLEDIGRDLAELHRAGALDSCVLSGKASSIAALNRQIKRLGIARDRVRTKAYWAPGKTGLD